VADRGGSIVIGRDKLINNSRPVSVNGAPAAGGIFDNNIDRIDPAARGTLIMIYIFVKKTQIRNKWSWGNVRT
jgi:hypothetical protein